MEYPFEPIGLIHSCFKEKFGIPRQPGLVPAARATLELLPPYDREEALRGLEGFSHLWVIFVFHATADKGWSPTVRPPRLGGNERIGVFATRSTFRPNPIGLSVVGLEGFSRAHGKLQLQLKGIDLLDGTPVLDIKPYLPYADALPHASAGYASATPGSELTVDFAPEAEAACIAAAGSCPELRELITQLVSNDPRPAYRRQAEGTFGVRLYGFDVRWTIGANGARITEISDTASVSAG